MSYRKGIVAFFMVIATLSCNHAQAFTKHLGMGITGVAYPQDTGVGLINPAGMVELGNRIDIGAALWAQSGSAHVEGNSNPDANGSWNCCSTFGSKYNPLFPAGFNLMLSPNFSIGASAGSKLFPSHTDLGRPFPLSGTTRAGTELNPVQLALTASYKFFEKHFLGFAVNVNIQRANVKGVQNLISVSRYPTKVTNRGLDYAWGYGLTFGWMSHITPCLSIGAKYDTIVKNSAFTKYRGFTPTKGRVDLPAHFVVGIAYKFNPCLVLTFDAERIYTNQIPVWTNPIYPNAFESLQGESSSVGHGVKSNWLYHLGASYTVNCNITTRAGYMYTKSAIRRGQTLNNHLSLTPMPEHYFFVGGTWSCCDKWDVSLGYMHALKKKVRGKNSIAPEFGGGELDISQRMDILMGTVGWNF